MVYTETAVHAAIQGATHQDVINLDDARDTFAPQIVERLASLQVTESRGRALADLSDLIQLASEVARIAQDARDHMLGR